MHRTKTPGSHFKEGSFAKVFSITFATQTLTVFLSFGINIIIARSLGAEANGIYATYVITLTFMATLLGFGFQWSNTYLAAKNRECLNDIFTNSLLSTAATGIVLGLLFFISGGKLLCFLKLESNITVMIVLSFPFMLLMLNNQAALLGIEEVTFYNITFLLKVLTRILLMFLLIVCFGMGVGGMLTASLLSLASGGLLAAFHISKKINWKFRANWKTFLESISVGKRAALANFLGLLAIRINIFMVGSYLSQRSVGYFYIAVLFADLVFFIPNVAGKLLMVKSSGDKAGMAPLLAAKICRVVEPILVFYCIFVAILGKFLIPLVFGSKFVLSYYLFLILIPGVILSGIDIVLSNFVAGKGYPSILYIFNASTLVINVILNLLLIQKLGVVGSVIALSVSYSIRAILMLIYFVRITNISCTHLLIPHREDWATVKDFLRTKSTDYDLI